MTDPPIRRPFGAVPVADGLVEFRVWAPSATRVAVRLDERRPRARARLGGRLTRAASRRCRATTTATSSTAASRFPTPGRASSRRASSAPRAIVDTAQLRVVGRRLGRCSARRARALRAARRHLHRGGHLRGGDPAPARARRARRDRDRADAGGDVPGRARLGLRRVLRLRAAPGVRRPGRARPASSTPRTPPVSACSSTSSTTTSAPAPSASPPSARTSPTATTRSGATRSTTRRTACASGRSRTRSTGSATSTSTASASTPTHAIFDDAPAPRPGRARRPRPRRRPARARHLRDDDRRPAPDRGVGARRAVGGRAPPRAARAPHRRARGLLRRLPRLRGGDRAPARSARPRSGSSSARRTTTRSATAPFGDRPARELQPLRRCVLLFAPQTPLLFMGQEHGEPAPFQFFTDHVDPFDRRRHARGPPQRVPASPASRPRTCPTRRPGTRSSARS